MRVVAFLGAIMASMAVAACRDVPFAPLPLAASDPNAAIIVNALPPRVPLAMGEQFTCALNRAGQAYCWGLGNRGQLGNGTTVTVSTPVPVAQGSLRFNAIAAGYPGFACALTGTGVAYCWGSNSHGELGIGCFDTCGSTNPAEQTAVALFTPRPVAQGNVRFTSILTGTRFACALAVGGKAYCWGDNTNGQLGNGAYGCCGGSAPHVSTPAPVAQGSLVFTSLTLHGVSACGLTAAGQAWCWGLNESGQVGNGDVRPAQSTPAPVQQGSLRFIALQANNYTTCGLVASGQVYCWGYLGWGEFGQSPTSLLPTPVNNPLGFSALASNGLGLCGLTPATPGVAAGTAFCWGENFMGQLGNADLALAAQRRPVPVSTIQTFIMFANSGGPGMCGLTSAGQIYCWGLNNHGQLGNGTETGPVQTPAGFLIPFPVLVVSDQVFG